MRGLASSEVPSASLHLQEQHLREDQDSKNDLTQEKAFFTSAAIKQSKTNSERGRAFRARRKKYEDDLWMVVRSLRKEVAHLDFLRNVRAGKVLSTRNDICVSLVRLYFALFERGMPSVRNVGSKRPALLTDGTSVGSSGESLAMKQKAFIMSAMDSQLQFGGVSGRNSLLDQWKKYTSYHSRIHVEVVGIKVSGEENDPIVTVYSDLHVVFSRATFEHIFPHVMNNEELVNKFIGREIVYHGVNRFQFSPKGQILVYDSDVGLVDALVRAGASVSDVAMLTQQARIADGFRLEGEDDNNNQEQGREQDDQDEIIFLEDDYSRGKCDCAAEESDSAPEDNERIGSDVEDMVSPERNRFTIDFLLS